MQYVFHSPHTRYSLIQTALFSCQAIALFALAPLIAIRFENADAATYTFLLASMGTGGIIIALNLSALRRRFKIYDFVVYGTLLSASMMIVVAWTTYLILAAVAMMFAGMAFVAVLNSLHFLAQLSLPNWVRARGMAWVQMATMGGCALGAAIWGKVAEGAGIQASLIAAALTAILGLWMARRLCINGLDEDSTFSAR